jgi:hypothetical protein
MRNLLLASIVLALGCSSGGGPAVTTSPGGDASAGVDGFDHETAPAIDVGQVEVMATGGAPVGPGDVSGGVSGTGGASPDDAGPIGGAGADDAQGAGGASGPDVGAGETGAGGGGVPPCSDAYSWPRRPDGSALTADELAQLPPSCGLTPGQQTSCYEVVGGVYHVATKDLPGLGRVACVRCSYWPSDRMPPAPECLRGGGTVCHPRCAGGTECVTGVAAVCVVACGECQ